MPTNIGGPYFAPGDQVYLSTDNFPTVSAGSLGKAEAPLGRPMQVEQRIGEVAYKLVADRRFHTKHPIFYMSQLKPIRERNRAGQRHPYRGPRLGSDYRCLSQRF